MKSIFIAYSHKDKVITRFIYQALINREWSDIDIFLDEFSIIPGEDIKTKCLEKSRNCDLGIVILTEYTLKSEYAPQEIGIILARNIPKIYIVLHEDYNVPPGYENTIKSFPFYGWKNPHEGINELINTIELILTPQKNILQAPELVGLASAMSKQGNYKAALEYTDKALEIDPKNDFALANRISYLRRLGKYTEAYIAADEALSIYPNNPSMMKRKALIFMTQNKYEEAKNILKRVIEITERKDQSTLYYYGKCLLETNKYEEAKKIFDECYKMNVSSKWANNSIAKLGIIKSKLINIK